MKNPSLILLLVLFLLPWYDAAAQQPCFDALYQEGKTACEHRKFGTAMQCFRAAHNCADQPSGTDLEAWIARTDRGHREQVAWQRALDADKGADWEFFLEHFPDGHYRVQAEEHLARAQAIEAKSIVQSTATGLINWTQEFVEATGEAAIRRDKWPDEAQAVRAAISGAKAMAQSNLLENLGQIHIRRQTTMISLMTTDAEVKTRVSDLARHASVVGEPSIGKEWVVVGVRVPIFGPGGLAAAVLPLPTDLVPDTSAIPADIPETALPEWTLLLPPGTPPPFTLFAIFADARNVLLLDGSTTPSADSAPLARWFRGKPSDFFPKENTFEAKLSSMGHILLPDAALPLFQAWKHARETGAGALPVRIVVR